MKNFILLQRHAALKKSTNKSQSLSFNGNIPITDIASKILYWDKIVNLEIINIHPQETSDILHLKQEGIYESVPIDFSPFPIDDSFIDNFAESTKNKIIELLNNKSINYVIEDISKDIYADECISHGSSGSLIQLTNVLPFPDNNTHIDKLLEFRLKRGDMHRDLINAINTLELRVSSAENQAHELKSAINEIDIKCHEAIKVYKESGLNIYLSKVKFNLKVKDIVDIVAKVYVGAALFLPHTSATYCAIAAGIASTMDFSESVSIKGIDKSNPFNYVAEVNKYLL
ncbi:TPA: hypothetical protein OL679_001825 [Klebsiella pneumoniae]|nr:hypothetical protein [Klebsiella pneumoniae]HCQ6978931.1 hypothetical protein [Klebsiella pneumoniae]